MTAIEIPEDLLPGDKLRRNFDDAPGYKLLRFFIDERGRGWWRVVSPYGLTTLPDNKIRQCFHKDMPKSGESR